MNREIWIHPHLLWHDPEFIRSRHCELLCPDLTSDIALLLVLLPSRSEVTLCGLLSTFLTFSDVTHCKMIMTSSDAVFLCSNLCSSLSDLSFTERSFSENHSSENFFDQNSSNRRLEHCFSEQNILNVSEHIFLKHRGYSQHRQVSVSGFFNRFPSTKFHSLPTIVSTLGVYRHRPVCPASGGQVVEV